LTIDDAIRQCGAALASSEALESIGREPYWPKWDSSWWHMTLLWEMGEAAHIPRVAAEAMTHAFENHYIHIFRDPTTFHRGAPCSATHRATA
jgi:hypothetical protein